MSTNHQAAVACRDCRTCGSRLASVFAPLEAAALEELDRSRHARVYRRGQLVFSAGEDAEHVYCMQSGLVKVSKVASRGRDHLLQLALPGDVLALDTLVTGTPHATTAEALEESVVCHVDGALVRRLLSSRLDVAGAVLKVLGTDIATSQAERAELAAGDVRERLAYTLLRLKQKFGQGNGDGVEIGIPLSRDELASMVGTATETLIRQLTELDRRGVIAKRGRKIAILDAERLARIAHRPTASV